MTARQICDIANSTGMASRDTDLMVMLGANVLPAYLHDIGYTSWMRRDVDIIVGQGDWSFPIPIHIVWVQSVSPKNVPGQPVDPNRQYTTELRYIGEDMAGRRSTVAPTATGDPDSYTITLDITDLQLNPATGRRRIWLNKILSAETTYRVTGTVGLGAGEDYTSDYNMNDIVPPEYQWGLVEGLKAQLVLERWGQADRRYPLYRDQRDAWVMRAQERKEMTRQNHYVYAK